jgi:hypothetical protein
MMTTNPIIAGHSPFHASNTPSRTETLRRMYNTKGRLDMATKPAPVVKNKHWTEVPERVTEIHNATRDLINEYDLTKPQGAEWTPEMFIIEKGIDTSKGYSEVRSAIREAVKQAYVDDLTTILTENGVTELADQQKAFAPYESLQEVVTMTGVNIKRIRTQVCSFASAHYKEASIASMHKEQPTMTPDEAALRAIPFDAPDDKPEDLGAWFPRSDETINPEATNAPNVNTIKPTAKPLPDHGLLKVRLFNLLNDTFGDPDIEKEENKRVISYHLKTALRSDTFDIYMASHLPEDAAIAVDAYIQAELARRAKTPPSSPVSVAPQPEPTAPITQDVLREPLALVPSRHAESPVTCYPSPRGEVVYKGVRYDVSFREGAKAETALELLSEWDRFWKMGEQHGVQRADMQQPIAPAATQPAQPATPQTPAQPASDGGEVTCVLITVGTSFTDPSKLQLEFTIDGWDKPLRFTKPPDKMVQLLANVRKFDGTPFTAADFTNGKKMFPGNWKVAYRPSQKDSKYNDVMAVKAA